MKRSFVFVALALALPPSAPAQPEKEKATYRNVAVRRGTFQPAVVAAGTLQPEEILDVAAPVAGTVVKVGADPRDKDRAVDSGTPVEEGTVLVQFDPALYRARVEQARAKVSKAESESRLGDAQLRRAEFLVARIEKLGAIGVTDLDRARYDLELARAHGVIQRAAIQEAEAALQEAELRLGQTTVRSPGKGVVLDRRVNLGQAVAPGPQSPALFVIARDLKRMQILAQVHEADIALVKAAQAVTFKVEAFPRDSFKGTVSQVRLNATPVKGAVTYAVVVHVENADGKLLPYLTADVRIPVGEKKNVLLVPNAALNWLPEVQQVIPSARGQFYELESLRKEGRVRRVVWVEDRGHVRPVVIRAGLSDGQSTEVVEGELAEGAAVVVGN